MMEPPLTTSTFESLSVSIFHNEVEGLSFPPSPLPSPLLSAQEGDTVITEARSKPINIAFVILLIIVFFEITLLTVPGSLYKHYVLAIVQKQGTWILV